MLIHKTRFGDVEYTPEDVISFDTGIIGFPDYHEFLLITHKSNTPFRWLQSIDEPAMAFLVAMPEYFVPTYAPELDSAIAAEMGLEEQTPRITLTTVSIPKGKPEEMTINLAGPILINGETMRARQIVLDDEAYTIRHRVYQANRVSENIAA